MAADEEAAEVVAAAPDGATLDEWVCRREQGEPLAWITGITRFCGLTLHVEPGVYVPRPQTEELARRAAGLLGPGQRAADLCTGVGAVAAYLLRRGQRAAVVGVDLDPRAAACARRNGVPAVVGDLAAPLASTSFHVVTAVAPYVPTAEIRWLPADVQRFEPPAALDGGADGLDLVRRVVTDAARLLEPGGHLLIEVGGEQDAWLAPVLAAARFDRVTSWFDDEGDLRGVVAELSG